MELNVERSPAQLIPRKKHSSSHLPSPPPSNDGSSGTDSKRPSPVLTSVEPTFENGLFTPPRAFDSPNRKFRKLNNGRKVVPTQAGQTRLDALLKKPLEFVPSSVAFDDARHRRKTDNVSYPEEHRLRREKVGRTVPAHAMCKRLMH